MPRYFFFLILLFLVYFPGGQSQDTISIKDESPEILALPEETGILSEKATQLQLRALPFYHFRKAVGSEEKYSGKEFIYFKFIVKNSTPKIISISISKNGKDQMNAFVIDNEGELAVLDKVNIRGRILYGHVDLPPNSSVNLYTEIKQEKKNGSWNLGELKFRIINHSTYLEKEMRNRFVDSLLIGLLLFSALLNLIIGRILQTKSFITLFFYLASLALFSISFLGFYDEFLFERNIHFPIGLPSYILTLILFLFLSKHYLNLEKNLPGWNTVTNVIIFFLVLAIPYYYLTVYISRFYNEFLAFSSLLLFILAVLVGLIESILVFKKEAKSRYFLIANIIILISLGVNIFLDNKYPVIMGSVLQGFIFTIGLAAEIKLIDNQKHKFQQRYTNQLELNLKLKDKLTLDLERKVDERTVELKAANTELVQKNRMVEAQKKLLLLRNQNIKKSIEYAKRIQGASFPSPKILEKITSESFILYKPRDIVSGDFYWFGEVSGKVIIIAADCTGHGVPGAFMSMYGIAFLNEIINKEKIYRPDKILNMLREKITSTLNRGDNDFETMDGMDMAVVTLDSKSNKILFAGANNPLYYVREGEINKIEPDKMPVAFFQKMEPFHYTHFESSPGDSLYIFTDGIIDQFGGELGKKFLNRRFRDLLLENSSLSMADQKQRIDRTFLDWKGDYYQVDDILVIGFRL